MPHLIPPPAPPQRPPLRRAGQGRVVAGVCRGLADHLGLHPLVLRALFVALTAVGGVGALVYAFLWATIEPAEPDPHAPAQQGRWLRQPDSGTLLVLGGGLVVLVGALALLQGQGIDLRLDITIPVLVLTLGAVFVWSQLDTSGRDRFLAQQGAPGSRRWAGW